MEHNYLTKNDYIFIRNIIKEYINDNKLSYFVNEIYFNEIYHKLNVIIGDGNTKYSIYDKDFNKIK
jgi:hypothetical protein